MDRRSTLFTLAFAPAALPGLLPGRTAHAAPTVSVDRFYGEYIGEAITQQGEDLDKRDIHAKIFADGKGFGVTWTMVVTKQSGSPRRDEYTIRFQPSQRENIYASAMRRDAFGNAVPLDPIKGDPYFWARLEGQTLTIFALLITENGGYEIQVYERSLQPGGLGLRFTRVRDGNLKRTITGTLKKIK
jgi:hypothetical protein